MDSGEIKSFCSSATHAPPTKVRTSTVHLHLLSPPTPTPHRSNWLTHATPAGGKFILTYCNMFINFRNTGGGDTGGGGQWMLKLLFVKHRTS